MEMPTLSMGCYALKQLRAGQAAEAVADSLRLLLLVLPFKATAVQAINMIRIRVNDANYTYCSGTSVQLIGHKKQIVITSGQYGTVGIKSGLLVP
jgi:hypothetical protein